MIYKKIKLSDYYECIKNSDATLTIYCIERKKEWTNNYKRYPMLIIPGGAYEYCSQREGEPVAFAYLAQGFNCFVLNYTCQQKYPTPQLEVACAMDYIESNVDKYDLFKNSKCMVGFSAGGHLAASYSAYYEDFAKKCNLDVNKIKPIYQVLGYPVISFVNPTNMRTKQIITQNDESLFDKLSIERHITKSFPITYIWTTKDDEAVPPSNSTDFYDSLCENGVVSFLRMYSHGLHGRAIATNETEMHLEPLDKHLLEIQNWVSESTQFFLKNKPNQ